MTAPAATGGMQWQQGDISVSLDVAPAEVPAALSRVWQRFLDGVESLRDDEFEEPTRCSEWRVVDIVNHLADTGSWVADNIDAAAEGRRSTVFDGFEPIGVPKKLTDAADRTPAVARRRLVEAIEGNRARLAALDLDAAATMRVETPLGAQPPLVGLTHLFWDTWLHERDLFLPLGRPVPQLADDVRLAALYSLRMEGYIQTLMHREVHAGLALSGACDDTLTLDVTPSELRIAVAREAVPAERLLRGDGATVVDALSGRGDLAEALQGDEALRGSIAVLRTVLAGR